MSGTTVAQGEIVVERRGDMILLHGIGLHPFQSTTAWIKVSKPKPVRHYVEQMARRFVVDSVVVLVDYHPTGRIYEVRSTRL